MSGFTGSAGVAIVTPSRAALWTDGRYYLQAEQEMSDQWTLMKQGEWTNGYLMIECAFFYFSY